MSLLHGNAFTLVAAACCALLAVNACSTEEGPPRRGSGSTGTGNTFPSGSGGAATGACEGDEIQGCKVWIDENNCFVGEQQCDEGEWGPCVDPGELSSASHKTKSVSGGPADCMTNPCNPDCQTFVEDPADLTAAGMGAPMGGTGDTSDLNGQWAQACLHDIACGSCSSTGSCQYDTYCNAAGDTCVPFADGEVQPDAVMDKPDFTIKVVCDPSAVEVCNRSNFTAGAGVGIVGVTPDYGNCGFSLPSSCSDAVKDGFGGYKGECEIPVDIMPGQCISVDCSAAISGETMLFVNSTDHFSGPPDPPIFYNGEHKENNNWSVYSPTTSCSCSSSTVSSTIEPVNMYLMLDSSGSMLSGGWGASPDLWTPATAAIKAFAQSDLANDITLSFRTFDNVAGTGDDNCRTGCPNDLDTPQQVAPYGPGTGIGTFPPSAASITDCATPHVGPLSLEFAANDMAFVTDIDNNRSATGGTPHWSMMEGAAQWANSIAAGSQEVVVYITDGEEGCGYHAGTYCPGGYVSCGFFCWTCPPGEVSWNYQDQPHRDAIAAPIAASNGSNGTLAFAVALDGADLPLLDTIAAAGGTATVNLQGSMDVNNDLIAALTAITQSVVSCSIPIADPTAIDPMALDVTWVDSGMTANMLTQVANLAACTGGNEWYPLPDAANPTSIELCPDVCSAIRADVGSEVTYEAGCLGGYTPASFEYDYYAACPNPPFSSGARGAWDYLEFETTVPGDAEIIWEMSLGNTDMEAMAGNWIEVARSTSGAGEDAALPLTAVDLRAQLGPLYQQEYMYLRITLNPTTDGTGTPTVHDWDISYTCEDSE